MYPRSLAELSHDPRRMQASLTAPLSAVMALISYPTLFSTYWPVNMAHWRSSPRIPAEIRLPTRCSMTACCFLTAQRTAAVRSTCLSYHCGKCYYELPEHDHIKPRLVFGLGEHTVDYSLGFGPWIFVP
jgi:hypothetical protein